MASKCSEVRAVAEEATTILALPQQRLDEWMMRPLYRLTCATRR